MIIDIQSSMRFGKGPAYEKWGIVSMLAVLCVFANVICKPVIDNG
ncbi:hypothetical protein [Clostridium argentinense]|nr:hypothetical protein [Clostridium argentinense]